MNSSSTAPSPSATTENAPVGRGRPRVLTPEIAQEILKMIRVYGLSDSHAALLAGVSSSSICRWKQASEEFSDWLEGARAEFERDRVLALLDATKPDGTPDWRAQAWLLRNAPREGWGRAANPLHHTTPKTPEILPKNGDSGAIPELRRPAESDPTSPRRRKSGPLMSSASSSRKRAESFPKMPSF